MKGWKGDKMICPHTLIQLNTTIVPSLLHIHRHTIHTLSLTHTHPPTLTFSLTHTHTTHTHTRKHTHPCTHTHPSHTHTCHLETKSLELIAKKVESASVATAFAKNDLPVPGGPYNKIPNIGIGAKRINSKIRMSKNNDK